MKIKMMCKEMKDKPYIRYCIVKRSAEYYNTIYFTTYEKAIAYFDKVCKQWFKERRYNLWIELYSSQESIMYVARYEGLKLYSGQDPIDRTLDDDDKYIYRYGRC